MRYQHVRRSLCTFLREFRSPLHWSRGLVCILAISTSLAVPTISFAQDATPWPKPKETSPKKDSKPADKRDAKPVEQPKRQETERERLKREASGLFGGPAQPSPSGDGEHSAAGRGPAGWTIVLGVFRGEERDSASRVMLQRVQTEGGLPNAFAVRRNEAVVVAVGDFPSVDDAKAKSELARVQDMTFGTLKPYAHAFLAPPESSREGSQPEYNLKRAKDMFGDSGIYTLQVGAYGRRDLKNPSEADLAETRKAAEAAAFKLRQEGEVAFYYHGRTMSMVTVGVFTLDDYDPQTPNYSSSRLRDAKQRFPYNLYNGAGIKQTLKGNSQIQASSLVALPKK